MIPPALLAQACSDIYADAPEGFEHLWTFSGCHAALRKLDGVDVIVFRGSKDALALMDDAFAVPLWDYQLGFVHAGFLVGVRDVLVAASLVTGPLVAVTGHSLGGARARILAALLAYSGKPVSQCCVFGSPRPGFENLKRVLEKSGTPLSSYRNRADPIPLVPFFGGLYVHPDPWIALDAPSPATDLEPLRDHHMARYLEGLAALKLDVKP